MSSKKISLVLSSIIFVSWWIIIYISSYLGASLNMQLFGVGGEGKRFIFYYYMIALLITAIIYIVIVPVCIKDREKRAILFRSMKVNSISKVGFYYVIIIAIGAILGYIIFRNIYGNSTLEYITAVQPPIVEELLFRGLILSILLNSFNKKISIIISSILFGLIHICLSPMNVIFAFFIGVIYCIITIRSKSILPVVIIHYIQGTNLYQLMIVIVGLVFYEVYILIKNRNMRNGIDM